MTWVLMTWESFDTDQSTSFDLDAVGTPYNNFRESYSHIKRNIVELRAVWTVIEQRIESLEKMSTVAFMTMSIFSLALDRMY